MRDVVAWPVAVILLALVSGGPARLAGQATPDCGASFADFDSRLTVEAIAVLPPGAATPIGFEIAATGPVVATRNALYAIRGDSVLAIPLAREISAIAVDAEGRLALQFGDGAALVRPGGLQPIAPWAGKLEGQLVNSGQADFMEVLSKDGDTVFGVRMPANDRVLPIARLTGELRAASWDDHGLLAVVGNSVVRWVRTGNVLERVTVDVGLAAASGLCTLGSDRTLVSLRTATVLIAGTAISVIGATGGRCRTSGDAVLLLDPRLRTVWRLTGFENVGGRERDLAYATRLLQLSVTQGTPFVRTREFSEAVRLIGCRKAHTIVSQLER